jgi:Ca2+-binding RTX toxin-like protein
MNNKAGFTPVVRVHNLENFMPEEEEPVGPGGGDDVTGGGDIDGDDTVTGGSGTDTVTGGSDTDTVTGGSDTDTVTGGEGSDTTPGGSEYNEDNGEETLPDIDDINGSGGTVTPGEEF